MSAWLFQRKQGKGNPWSVGWYDPSGKRREKQIGTKTHAKSFRDKINGELATATYESIIPINWKNFQMEFERDALASRKPSTVVQYRIALKHFERIINPKRLKDISSKTFDEYTARRLKERGSKPGSTVSRATVNAELRVFRLMMRLAVKWKHAAGDIEVSTLKELDHMKRVVPFDHFDLMFSHCDSAINPTEFPYQAGDWWRAFLTFTYLTGWRKSEPLQLLRSDVDLKNGSAITRAEHNKGGRDERVPLHPLVIELLREIPGFTAEMFPWHKSHRGLYDDFKRIKQAAGIELECAGNHSGDCTESCKYYSFHDLRRGFATITGGNLDSRRLQKMMRHKDFKTTQGYIDMRHQMDGITDQLVVPALNRKPVKIAK